MDKYQLLYMDSKGVRRVKELDITDRIEVIGITRYTHFETPHMADYELNGSYPVIKAEEFNDMYGKVLTVVDASFPEGAQKEAFKSLIKSNMSDWYSKNVNYVMKMTDQALKSKKNCTCDGNSACSECK